jgi:hypothetical protein
MTGFLDVERSSYVVISLRNYQGIALFYSRRKKEEGRRKKEEAIKSIVSAINNVLTVLAVAISKI